MLGRTETARIALVRGAPIAALFAAAVAVYLVLTLRSPLPVMFPDEFRYAHLARSLADGNGFDWRGDSISQPAALYIYVLTPIWALFTSTVTAYELSKTVNCILLSAQVFPVYLLARPLLGRRFALIPAAMSVAGTWMVVSAHLITEDLGIPLGVTALCLAAMTLYRPSRRTGFMAIAFALLATWARIQLAVLVPAIALSFALDILVQPREQRRERLDAHLYHLGAAVGVSVVGLIVVLGAPSLTGGYSDLFGDHPGLTTALGKTALELGGLVTASGFVPVLLLAGAGIARPLVWRDQRLGPLLLVFWPAALAICLQAGLFLAGVGTHRDLWWGIERYVVYALPIAFVAICVLLADRRSLVDLRVLGAAAALGLLLLFHPGRVAVSEERAAWSTSYRLHQLLGLGTGVALALAAVAGLAIVALVMRLSAGRQTIAAALLLTASLLLVQDQASWHYLTNVTRTFRHSVPADLQWVDHNSHGPVALINLTAWDPTVATVDFFNRDITASYGPPTGLAGRELPGRTCSWVVQADGRMLFQPGCGVTPHAFFVNDPSTRLTWQHEIYSVSNPKIGRIARLAASSPPRLRSLIVLPCPRATPSFSLTSTRFIPASAPFSCGTQLGGELWLSDPGTLTISYAGGDSARAVTLNGKHWALPAHALTRVTIPVPLGQYRFKVIQNWRRNLGNPSVAAIRLSSGGSTVPLI